MIETTGTLFEYDELKMYFGEDYWVTDKICIKQPNIGDILEFGEKKFYSIVSTLCSNPTSHRLQLWDMAIDWNEISDFELFIQLIKVYNQEDTYLLFGDLNLSWFETFYDKELDRILLIYIPRDEHGNKTDVDIENTIIIDELIYTRVVDYLRTMFDIHPKIEKAKGKITKQALIDEDRMNLKIEERKNKGKKVQKSVLYPLISSMLNHPGFKYKKSELKEVGIVEFMDSVKRLQTYESVRALMTGMYSGMLDTSKMDLNKELNWTRDLYN